MKWYDITSDTMLTERAEIIDRLTSVAAATLTFSERRALGQRSIAQAGMTLLRKALGDRSAETWALRQVVCDLWRSQVAA